LIEGTYLAKASIISVYHETEMGKKKKRGRNIWWNVQRNVLWKWQPGNRKNAVGLESRTVSVQEGPCNVEAAGADVVRPFSGSQ
jgi:hypothetical protein